MEAAGTPWHLEGVHGLAWARRLQEETVMDKHQCMLHAAQHTFFNEGMLRAMLGALLL